MNKDDPKHKFQSLKIQEKAIKALRRIYSRRLGFRFKLKWGLGFILALHVLVSAVLFTLYVWGSTLILDMKMSCMLIFYCSIFSLVSPLMMVTVCVSLSIALCATLSIFFAKRTEVRGMWIAALFNVEFFCHTVVLLIGVSFIYNHISQHSSSSFLAWGFLPFLIMSFSALVRSLSSRPRGWVFNSSTLIGVVAFSILATIRCDGSNHFGIFGDEDPADVLPWSVIVIPLQVSLVLLGVKLLVQAIIHMELLPDPIVGDFANVNNQSPEIEDKAMDENALDDKIRLVIPETASLRSDHASPVASPAQSPFGQVGLSISDATHLPNKLSDDHQLLHNSNPDAVLNIPKRSFISEMMTIIYDSLWSIAASVDTPTNLYSDSCSIPRGSKFFESGWRVLSLGGLIYFVVELGSLSVSFDDYSRVWEALYEKSQDGSDGLGIWVQKLVNDNALSSIGINEALLQQYISNLQDSAVSSLVNLASTGVSDDNTDSNVSNLLQHMVIAKNKRIKNKTHNSNQRSRTIQNSSRNWQAPNTNFKTKPRQLKTISKRTAFLAVRSSDEQVGEEENENSDAFAEGMDDLSKSDEIMEDMQNSGIEPSTNNATQDDETSNGDEENNNNTTSSTISQIVSNTTQSIAAATSTLVDQLIDELDRNEENSVTSQIIAEYDSIIEKITQILLNMVIAVLLMQPSLANLFGGMIELCGFSWMDSSKPSSTAKDKNQGDNVTSHLNDSSEYYKLHKHYIVENNDQLSDSNDSNDDDENNDSDDEVVHARRRNDDDLAFKSTETNNKTNVMRRREKSRAVQNLHSDDEDDEDDDLENDVVMFKGSAPRGSLHSRSLHTENALFTSGKYDDDDDDDEDTIRLKED